MASLLVPDAALRAARAGPEVHPMSRVSLSLSISQV